MLLTTRCLTATLTLATLAACGVDFDPYNLLTELRLLAVRAEQPIVPIGGTTEIDALVYHPDDAAPEYVWSWCPLRGGAQQGYECFVTEEQMQDLAHSPDPVSFDLGTAETATFAHLAPPEQLAEICTQPLGPFDRETGGSIDCSKGFPISIGLTVRLGKDEVRSFKTIYLALDAAAAPNANPEIDALFMGEEDAERGDCQKLEAAATSFRATLGERYVLFADIAEETAETYVPPAPEDGEAVPAVREYLAVTWFVEAGDTRSKRTTFIDGQVGFDVLEENEWKMPQPEKVNGDSARIYLVVRDDRGGIGWLAREVGLIR